MFAIRYEQAGSSGQQAGHLGFGIEDGGCNVLTIRQFVMLLESAYTSPAADEQRLLCMLTLAGH